MSSRSTRVLVALAVCGLAMLPAAAAAAAAGVPPSNLTVPKITGSPVQGQTLTATNGTWSGTPTSFTYVWKTCNANGQACVSLTRQTARTHVITASDVGHRLRVVVRASNAFGASTARSAVTVVVTASAPTAPVGGTKPAVSGTVQAGQTLTTSNGTWTGTTPMTYAYKWQRCDSAGAACTAITGAAARTYMIAGGDVGRTLRSQVVAFNGAGSVGRLRRTRP